MQYLGICLFMLFKNTFKAHKDYLIYKYLGITSWKKKIVSTSLYVKTFSKDFVPMAYGPSMSKPWLIILALPKINHLATNNVASELALFIVEIQFHVEEPIDLFKAILRYAS